MLADVSSLRSGLAGKLPTIRFRRREAAPGDTVVLMYHRVADIELDEGRLAVAPERFTEQIEAIGSPSRRSPSFARRRATRRSGSATVRRSDLRRRIPRQPRRGQARAGALRRSRHGLRGERLCRVRATILVGRARAHLYDASGPSWDRLELEVGQRVRTWNISDDDGRRALYRLLREALWTLDDCDREETLSHFATGAGLRRPTDTTP